MRKKVVKFGGSSLASAEQFKKEEILSVPMKEEDMWFHQRRERGITMI